MKTVTSAEFQRHFGRFQDEALVNPISITRNGREHLVLISAEEYRRIIRSMRQVKLAEELSEGDLAAIERAELPDGYAALDDELTK